MYSVLGSSASSHGPSPYSTLDTVQTILISSKQRGGRKEGRKEDVIRMNVVVYSQCHCRWIGKIKNLCPTTSPQFRFYGKICMHGIAE